jgi:hypothetical protein
MKNAITILLALFFLPVSFALWAFEPDPNDKMQLKVAGAILDIKQKDPGMQSFFDNSAGYAVFPTVGKGGIGIGGARGNGLVIVDGAWRSEICGVHIFQGRGCA